MIYETAQFCAAYLRKDLTETIEAGFRCFGLEEVKG